MDILSRCNSLIMFLLPVSRVVVRGCDAADLKSFVLVLVSSFSIEVDSELVVKTCEEISVRNLGLEERNLYTGYGLDG